MTIDERLEFLFKSTESLHDTALEQGRSIDKLIGTVADNTKQLAEQGKNIDKLVGVIEDLVEIARSHNARLTRLDGGAAA